MATPSELLQSSSTTQILLNEELTNKIKKDLEIPENVIVEETPLPWRQISILMAVRFAEPVGFTLLFPFMVFMVEDFNISDNPNDVTFYAGLLASSFAVSQVFSGVQWGMLSDRIGRRPVILMGLLGTAVSLFLFGLSKSLPWAIVTRSLCGLLNGNVGVIKSMMAELTDSTNRAKGFSLLPMVFGLGSIVGPMLGGYLSNPIKQYPWMFEDGIIKDFLTEYPYFLPCFISSSLCFLGTVFGFLYLEETLDSHLKPSDIATPISETTPLIRNVNSEVTLYNGQATPNSDNTKSPSTKFSISRSESELELNKGKELDLKIPKASWMTMYGYAGLCLQTVMLDELIPFWASALVSKGGLGFFSPDIGFLMAYSGVAILVIQLLFYSPVQRRLGTLVLYQSVFPFYAPVLLLYPFASSITVLNNPTLLWAYIFFITTWRTCTGVFAFTSVNILIAETCPNNKMLGKVNGLAQVLGSSMRAIGPALTGLAFSWSLKNEGGFILLSYPFTWILVFIVCLVNHYIALCISPSEV